MKTNNSFNMYLFLFVLLNVLLILSLVLTGRRKKGDFMVDSLAGEAFGGNEDTCFACLLIEIFSFCSEIS